jgi:hypothetical protein
VLWKVIAAMKQDINTRGPARESGRNLEIGGKYI